MAAQLSLSLIAAPDAVRLETRDVEGYEFTLGRGHDVDWSLLDPDRNILSRRHCTIVQEDGDWWVEDVSGNGTFLNQDSDPIGHGARRRLRDGDRVRMGPYEFQVRLTSAPASSPFAAGDASPWDDSAASAVSTSPASVPWSSGAPPARVASPFDAGDTPSAAAPAQGGNPFLATEPDGPPLSPGPDGPADGTWPPRSVTAVPPQEDWPPRAVPTPAPPHQPGSGNPFLVEPPGTDEPFPPVDHPRADPARVGAAPVPPIPASAEVAPANPFAEAGDQGAAPVVPPVRVADPPEPDIPPGQVERSAGSTADQAAAPMPAPTPLASPTPASARPGLSSPVLPVSAPPASGLQAPLAVGSTLAPTEPAGDRLLAALLDGAGLPDARPRDAEQTMRAVGEAFRAMVKGVRDAQRTRRTVRGEFRIAQTSFTQNPLKVAISDDDALEALLGAGRRGGMAAPRAVEEILLEIVQHELATFAAMQDAVRVLVDSLSPDRLRAQADQAGGLAVLPAQRKARAWDVFESEHARVAEALRDDFDSVFGKAFARAYERVMSEQGS